VSESERQWDPWTYNAHLKRVVDSGTYDLMVDLGFRTYTQIRVRLRGVNTAEMAGVSQESDEYEAGKKQATFVYDWFAWAEQEGNTQWPLRIRTRQSGQYGRWIVQVERKADNESLAERLKEEFDL
jgi:micrococcal nuclease